MTPLTSDQYDRLLMNLDNDRVQSRKGGGMNLSYLEAWDVRVHLIRFFGFGGWSYSMQDHRMVYEQEVITKEGKPAWEVVYQVTVCLHIHQLECSYTESAVGSSFGSRSEAHDNALKSAASDALKRAAMNLGTQFGLSLYDKGSREDVVRKTLHEPVREVDASQS